MPSRRRFLEVVAQGVACAACTGPLAACGDGPPAPPLEEDVVLTFAEYPELMTEGELVEIPTDVSGYDHPIFVRNEGNDEWTALGAYCNHQGCSVRPSSSGFQCPCHGARFGHDGALSKGPASADLATFETTSDGTALTIVAG